MILGSPGVNINAKYRWNEELHPQGTAADSNGFTALHAATWRSRLHVAEVLLKHGANVNARTEDDETPLISAAGDDDPPTRMAMVNLLLAWGADIFAQDDTGSTALDIARTLHHDDVAQMLKAKMHWLNLAPVAKRAGRLAIALKQMLRESSERVYAPDGVGFLAAHESFQTLCRVQADPVGAALSLMSARGGK